jgi:ATP-dependent DNA helicase RecQ
MGLKEKGIKADYLGSTQNNYRVTTDAKNGKIILLYMTPEKAVSLNKRFEILLLTYSQIHSFKLSFTNTIFYNLVSGTLSYLGVLVW